LSLLAAALVAGLAKITLRREHLERSSDANELVIVGTSAFLLAAHVLALRAAISADQRLETHALVALHCGLFVILGQALAKLRSNVIAGIRTPWTLGSEAVWDRTHRSASGVFSLGGIVIIAGALLLPEGSSAIWLVLAVSIFSAVTGVAYSPLRGSSRAERLGAEPRLHVTLNTRRESVINLSLSLRVNFVYCGFHRAPTTTETR
jgi:Ca2+/Na+ antiporter